MHRKTAVLESLFIKSTGLKTCNIIKKRLQHSYFPVNFAKFLRTAFFIEHLPWLPLNNYFSSNNTLIVVVSIFPIFYQFYQVHIIL